eukprot:3859851-Lingulodinium_polyedra.AAC.1
MARQALRAFRSPPEVAKAHNSVQPVHLHVCGPLVAYVMDRRARGIIWGNVEVKPGFGVHGPNALEVAS